MHADRAGQPPEGGEVGYERALQPDVGFEHTSDPSVPEPWLTEFDNENARNIDRLAADVDLHTSLALRNFTGRDYEKFQLELLRYGFDVVLGWLRTRKIVTRMQEKGYPMKTDGLDRLDRETEEELAGETVAKALYHFHHDVLLKRKWDASKGARLTTYFVGQCLIRFSNIYRDWRRQEMARFPPRDPTLTEDLTPLIQDGEDPQELAVARARIRRGIRGVQDERLQAVLGRLLAGRTHEETAAELGLTVKTVERMLANHRDRNRKRGIA